MTTTSGLRSRLAEQIKRMELASAAGQTVTAERYERLAAETERDLAALRQPQARATAHHVAGYGNPSRMAAEDEDDLNPDLSTRRSAGRWGGSRRSPQLETGLDADEA